MPTDKILLSYIVVDLVFLITGGLLIIFALTVEAQNKNAPTAANVANDLLLQTCPLRASIGNAVLVFITFLFSVPAMVLPMTRGWLKLSGYLTVVCALYTMIIGLSIWFETLKSRQLLSVVWNQVPSSTQSLLQQEFQCCGYANSTSPRYVPDSMCPDDATAAAQVGCVGPFSKYAGLFLDVVFTGAFGIVGVDVALILCTAILLKDRKEKERYRFIDEKSGAEGF
jgi:hypothetical protein